MEFKKLLHNKRIIISILLLVILILLLVFLNFLQPSNGGCYDEPYMTVMGVVTSEPVKNGESYSFSFNVSKDRGNPENEGRLFNIYCQSKLGPGSEITKDDKLILANPSSLDGGGVICEKIIDEKYLENPYYCNHKSDCQNWHGGIHCGCGNWYYEINSNPKHERYYNQCNQTYKEINMGCDCVNNRCEYKCYTKFCSDDY